MNQGREYSQSLINVNNEGRQNGGKRIRQIYRKRAF